MRVLCLADHVDPLIYTNGLKQRYGSVDIVLGAGDLALGYYDFVVSTLNKPLYFVFGNHHLENRADYKRWTDPFHPPSPHWKPTGVGAVCIEGKTVRARGLIIAGLGGSIFYNGGENQYTNTAMFFAVLRLIPALMWHRIFHGRWLDILLTHAPPYRINDLPDPCHTGFRSFLWFMRVFKPRFLVHGHVHLYDRNAPREARYAETTVINAYDHVVIEVEAEMRGVPRRTEMRGVPRRAGQ